MRKRIIAITGLLMTAVFLISFTMSTVRTSAADTVTYNTTLADYLATDEYALTYVNHKYLMPYRQCVEDLNDNMAFQRLLTDWEILTFRTCLHKQNVI